MAKKIKFSSGIDPHDGGDPDPGNFNDPTSPPDSGSGQPPSSKPVNVPAGNDYTGWNWEQALVGVLGLQLPSRDDVTNQRWTAINFNSPGGTGMYRIYAASWRKGTGAGAHQDTFVYLNPGLLQPGGIWDNYYHQPGQALFNANGSSGSGAGTSNYTGVQLDPRTFATAAAAVQGVIGLLDRSNNTMERLSFTLEGDQSAFKGQAGEAFSQLIDNLYKVVGGDLTQMTSPNNYAQLITDAGNQASGFLLSTWNAMMSWSAMLDHSPLGAIYQALLDKGVIVSAGGGNYQLADTHSTDSPFGDLTSADAWMNVEADAKELWLQSVASALDPVIQTALNGLVTSYGKATSGSAPLTAPTLTQFPPGGPDSANPT